MIKVIVVDDSPVVRSLIKEILSGDAEIEVVATACDPYDAREKIKLHNPDVITLDVEMPKMDGVTFLKNVMRLRPMPVVMISSLTEQGASVTLEALEVGAVDYMEKPKGDIKEGFYHYSEILIRKVKEASKVNINVLDRKKSQDITTKYQQNKTVIKKVGSTIDVIAIGASTGGTEAIKELLLTLPFKMPPIVIVQHIPPVFSSSYAKRLDRMLESQVNEVQDNNMRLIPGHIYLAPGDRHLEIKKTAKGYVTKLKDTEHVNRHKPAVDVLFDSVAKEVGKRSIGVILTGMGYDGAKGMLNLFNAGAHTIAQDKNSSVVWGMPGSAVETGGVASVLALEKIGRRLVKIIEGEKVS